jgi:hypothetical protein
MRKQVMAAAIAAIVACPVLASGYSVGRWTQMDGLYARAVVAGDVNWDKLDDLVVLAHDTDQGTDTVKIYLQQPDGTLRLDSNTVWWTNGYSLSLLLADLDDDSEPEILASQGAGVLELHYNVSSAYFTPVAINTPAGCDHIAAGDLDGDRYAELVCQSQSAGATVWHNAGDGKFLPGSSYVGTDPVAGAVINLADLTGDGRLDLLVSTPGAVDFAVYPNSGGWNFSSTGTRYAAPSTARISTSTIGDLDHDGKPEALIASNATAPDAAVWSYSAGAMAAPLKFATHDAPVGVIAHDLDRDGRDDLLVGSADGGVGQQLQGGTYAALGGSPFAGDSNSLAAGDLDNDGCTDIAYTTTTGAVAIAYGTGCVRARTHADFDGDGRSDLVWHNDATGAGTIWKAADAAHQQALTSVTNSAWRIAGAGDFNRDGRADLLWHNDVTGASTIWWSGNAATYQSLTRITDPAWRIVGIGDFDGDRMDDILWRNTSTGRNAVWRSANFTAQLAVTAVTNLDWVVAGVGDFDADGKDDILWRNARTGVNVAWGGAVVTSPLAVASLVDPAARVWVGDYDGDRHADLLWVTGGGYRIWLRPDGSRVQQNLLWPPSDWRIVTVGDYDGNGTADIVWRNMRNGQNAIWRSASGRASRTLTGVANFNWVIAR